MEDIYTYYVRRRILKKINKGYCDDNTLYYKHVITYNEFDQPIKSEEWIYNESGTTHYRKGKIPYFNCFGELKLNY